MYDCFNSKRLHKDVDVKTTCEHCYDSASKYSSLDSIVLDSERNTFSVDSSKNTLIKTLHTYDLICWSWQVARGMEYLTSRKVCS